MLNFTVGPVEIDENIRAIGYEPTPYFRTPEFSKIMFESENFLKELAGASKESRALFLTSSGTGAMEAALLNTLTPCDKVIVINGGSFGARFVELCKVHEIPYTELRLNPGEALTEKHLRAYNPNDYTGFIVNLHETSTGTVYDIDLIKEFCSQNKLFLIVDAISAFLADSFSMEYHEIDIMITASQKALACPPGISMLVISPRAIKKIQNNSIKSLYFNLKQALIDGERGQTPFTPAVTILLQLHKRLEILCKNGGQERERDRIQKLAAHFREGIAGLPFNVFSQSPSNAVTAISVKDNQAYDIFLTLKDKYNIWICPNGGELGKSIFRVGHIGALTIKDNNQLLEAFSDMYHKGLIK